MKVQTLILGALPTNCYIVSNNSNKAVVIDCGDEAIKVLSYAKKENLIIKKILLTHGHFDHMGAAAEIVEKTGATVYIHENDKKMLSSKTLSLSEFLPDFKFNPVYNVTTIDEGDIIKQDELEFSVIHTKGHTKGGVCYICEDCIFSGDTLFRGNVGRTDFPGGNFDEIIESVQKIAKLEGNFKVYPGHDMPSTLDHERKSNMYIKGTYNDNNF